jgi:predicted O-methyltransferase YrrM
LRAVIQRLHTASRAQEGEIGTYFARRIRANDLSWQGLDQDAHQFFADKLVALDDDKASFCHRLCRALGARTIVEVGTSHGLSTLYLADAVRANGGGVVIATEHEPAKAAAARAHFQEAGVADLVDLREGDLRETLRTIDGPVDFVLMDIWTEMVLPALTLIEPHLKAGAVIVADNTIQVATAYADYFEHLAAGGYTTQTLPFAGGLEFTVRL